MSVTEAGRQNTLGKGIISEAYIYNTISGKKVPMINYLLNIDIYEDIYTPYVYCDIALVDYQSFANQFPLSGEEYFVFAFQSFGGKISKYQFMLYNKENVAATDTNASTVYVLRGVTLERAFDAGITVSTAYTGTHSSIASQIFDRYVAKFTGGMPLQFEPSRSVDHYIPPQISPLKAIEEMRSRAVSVSEARSPFLFFRNSNGFYFMSMNGLFNVSAGEPSAQITHRYTSSSPGAEFDEENLNRTNADIISFEINTMYNTLEKIDNGGYNAHSYSFDLTTKWFGARQFFNMTEASGKFQLGGRGVHNRDSFMRTFDNTRCVAYYHPTDIAREFMGTTKDMYPEYMAEMNAYANMVSEYNVNYTIYGDSNVTAGQVMKILIPNSRDTDADDGSAHAPSMLYSGSFLLDSVRHSITIGENVDYYTVISGINGARDRQIEGM
jgi:hypothetical protein